MLDPLAAARAALDTAPDVAALERALAACVDAALAAGDAEAFADGQARYRARRAALATAAPSVAPRAPDPRIAPVRALATVPAATRDVALPTPLAQQAYDYAAQAKAANTRRAYRTDWADFAAWCATEGHAALPATPEAVALYITALAQRGRRPATIQRRLSSIAVAHELAGHARPTRHARVRTVLAGIRNALGVAQQGKAPAVLDELRAMVATCAGDGRRATRDRALLLLGFAGAFRRSELVALTVADLRFTRDGLVVALRRSKTDQEGRGRNVGIPLGRDPALCPVGAVRAWLAVARLDAGPVFRNVDRHARVAPRALTAQSVALVVKRCARAACLDVAQYSGHSLRAGLATSAAAGGAVERVIMAQTGHTSEKMARRYIREANLFKDNAARTAGL